MGSAWCATGQLLGQMVDLRPQVRRRSVVTVLSVGSVDERHRHPMSGPPVPWSPYLMALPWPWSGSGSVSRDLGKMDVWFPARSQTREVSGRAVRTSVALLAWLTHLLSVRPRSCLLAPEGHRPVSHSTCPPASGGEEGPRRATFGRPHASLPHATPRLDPALRPCPVSDDAGAQLRLCVTEEEGKRRDYGGHPMVGATTALRE